MARRLLLAAGVGLVIWAALVVPLPVILYLPGQPISLDEMVEVDLEGAALNGDFLLSRVRNRRGTFAGLLEVAVVEGAVVRPEAQVIPPGEADAAYYARQRDVFAMAAQVAAAVGLRAAGFDADPDRVVGTGVRVVSVIPGAPADGVLRSGDVIVGVDGTQVRAVDDLRGHIADGDAGARRLRFLRDGETREVELEPAEIRTSDGPVQGIGVQIQTHEPRVVLPAGVEVDDRGIGGPSAGVMIALAVYDKASPDVDLAAGRQVAGTGSLSAEGAVGSVGALRQKVLAAHRLGAEVFVVPQSQQEQARAALPSGSAMEILPVATFDEARAALAGGRLEARAPGSVRTPGRMALPSWSAPGGWTVRSRATPHREPGQGRKAAAISGSRRVPRSRRAVARPVVTTA